MKLSICVTFYNQEKYVDRALNSIFSQNISFPFEVLVGEDGSNDNTLDYVKKWKEKYPDKLHYWVMPRDNYVKKIGSYDRESANKLNLLQHAKGEYIAYLDGDDYYEEGSRFEELVRYMDAEENRSCAACFAPIYLHYENEGRDIVEYHHGDKVHRITKEEYFRLSYFTPSISWLYRNCYPQYPVPSILTKYFSDHSISLYFMKPGDLLYIPTATSKYCIYPESQYQSKTELERRINSYILAGLRSEYKELYSAMQYDFRGHIWEMYSSRKKMRELLGDVKYEAYLERAKQDHETDVIHMMSYMSYPAWKKFGLDVVYRFKLEMIAVGQKLWLLRRKYRRIE